MQDSSFKERSKKNADLSFSPVVYLLSVSLLLLLLLHQQERSKRRANSPDRKADRRVAREGRGIRDPASHRQCYGRAAHWRVSRLSI